MPKKLNLTLILVCIFVYGMADDFSVLSPRKKGLKLEGQNLIQLKHEKVDQSTNYWNCVSMDRVKVNIEQEIQESIPISP